MAGSKKNKVKKLLSPSSALAPAPEPSNIDDDDLMEDLFAQLNEKDQASTDEAATVIKETKFDKAADAVNTAPSTKQDSKSRHKARLARKAAALAENFGPTDAAADAKLEKEAREEERIITQTCDELGVKMHEINPDGHCLYSAVADQLSILGLVPSTKATYAAARQAAADYMQSHPDDFLPFLPSISEDVPGASNDGLMNPQQYTQYCKNVRETAVWGGEPEILALSRAYQVPIHVIQNGVPNIVVHNPLKDAEDRPVDTDRVVRISYHRRMYGLGEHYNSLRPKRSLTDGIKAIFSSSPPS